MKNNKFKKLVITASAVTVFLNPFGFKLLKNRNIITPAFSNNFNISYSNNNMKELLEFSRGLGVTLKIDNNEITFTKDYTEVIVYLDTNMMLVNGEYVGLNGNITKNGNWINMPTSQLINIFNPNYTMNLNNENEKENQSRKDTSSDNYIQLMDRDLNIKKLGKEYLIENNNGIIFINEEGCREVTGDNVEKYTRRGNVEYWIYDEENMQSKNMIITFDEKTKKSKEMYTLNSRDKYLDDYPFIKGDEIYIPLNNLLEYEKLTKVKNSVKETNYKPEESYKYVCPQNQVPDRTKIPSSYLLTEINPDFSNVKRIWEPFEIIPLSNEEKILLKDIKSRGDKKTDNYQARVDFHSFKLPDIDNDLYNYLSAEQICLYFEDYLKVVCEKFQISFPKILYTGDMDSISIYSKETGYLGVDILTLQRTFDCDSIAMEFVIDSLFNNAKTLNEYVKYRSIREGEFYVLHQIPLIYGNGEGYVESCDSDYKSEKYYNAKRSNENNKVKIYELQN